MAVVLLLAGAAALAPTASAASPRTQVVWVQNFYKSDYWPVSYSEVHTSDLRKGTSSALKLTFRLGKHIMSPWVRLLGDEARLRAYDDAGHFSEFDAKSGTYSWGSHDVGKTEQSIAADGIFFADNAVLPEHGRFFAAETIDGGGRHLRVHALDAKTGALLRADNGVIDVGEDTSASCGSMHTSWLPALEVLYVAKDYCSHSKPSRVFSFDPSTNATKAVYTAKEHQSFCAFAARPSTGELFALVETHDVTAFPDPDCQDLSGTVESMDVLRIGKDGQVATLRRMGPLSVGTMLTGGPLDDAAGVWHLLVGGSVTPVNLTAADGKMSASLTGRVDGGFPTLVPDAGLEVPPALDSNLEAFLV